MTKRKKKDLTKRKHLDRIDLTDDLPKKNRKEDKQDKAGTPYEKTKERKVTMQKELLAKLISEVVGNSGQLSAAEKEELELEKMEIEEWLEENKKLVAEKKTRLRDIEAILNGETKQEKQNLSLIEKLASNLGINIKEDLGIDLGITSSSRGGGGSRGKAVNSTWYVDGKKWINPRQEISYVLWTVTRGFGYQNGNGSLPLSEFRALVGDAWDNGESFEVVVTSRNGKKKVTIKREVEQIKQSDDHSQALINSLK